MLCFHHELTKVERPNPEELVFRASNTESFINSNRIDAGIVGFVSGFKCFSGIVDLEYQTTFRGNVDSL